MGVCPGQEHSVLREARKLQSHVWVWDGYLENRQVPDSDLARCEFLRGLQAYAETSKWQVTEYLLRDNRRISRGSSPPPSAEADPGKAQGPVEAQLLGAEGSHPARYEFLRGPWAYVETSKWQGMAFLLRVNQSALRVFPPLSAEVAREEEKEA
ncbi:hypothetical protein Celaphus_00009629 [Cervus elaphus hippelaphus]|uniref:MAGE domain-containing protein n=1 Tax=Cervus elaphus hippelaphus TaxID=46360 RepID=A0A212C178_CEREH|nr:hypothetical protein Celaphus_00009629 [Cervus elaphus hippelaphus]